MSENFSARCNPDQQSAVGDPLAGIAAYIAGLCDDPEPDFSTMSEAEYLSAMLDPREFAAHKEWRKYADTLLRFSEGTSALGDFTNRSMTAAIFAARLTAPHKIRSVKDGPCFSPAELISDKGLDKGKNLADTNVKADGMVPFDVDSGQQPWEATRELNALGIAHLLYSSWSNGTTRRTVPHDALLQHMEARGRKGDGPQAADVTAYLLEHGRVTRQLARSVHGDVKFAMEGKKRVWEFHTMPCPKFRIVVFIREAFPIFKPGVIGDNKLLYVEAYNKLAATLGILHDPSGATPAHLFYLPAHDDKVPAFSRLVEGAPFDFTAFADSVRHSAPDTTRKTGGVRSKNPEIGARVRQKDLKTANLFRFNTTCRGLFQIEDFVAAKEPEGIRQQSPRDGGIHCRCPNEDGSVTGRPHSDEDDKTTVFRVVNASDNTHGLGYAVNCLTGGCTEHFAGDALRFLDEMCDRYKVQDAEELLAFCSDHVEARRRWDEWDSLRVNRNGNPIPNQHNGRIALRRIGVTFSYNEFADTILIDGMPKHGPTLTDAGVADLRFRIEREFGFFLGKEFAYDFLGVVARENSFHPVKDYLTDVEKRWDRKSRLDTWLQKYAGVEDTPLYRAIGALWMIAGVRRIRQPGCKFDEILTFEAGQGVDKSTMLEVLAVKPEWFTDDVPMNATSKVVIEQTTGKWIIEYAEMAGASKAETEHMKASASRKVDRSRLAYGRFAKDFPRSFIGAATVNHERYLRDITGNRRHWPAPVRSINIDALRRDLDQLWGEAAAREKAGESIRLDKSLWGAAAAVQEARRVENAYVDRMAEALGERTGKISSESVYSLAGLPPDKRPQFAMDLVAEALAKLGWEKRPSLRFGKLVLKGYVKGTEHQQKVPLQVWFDNETKRYTVKEPDRIDQMFADAAEAR